MTLPQNPSDFKVTDEMVEKLFQQDFFDANLRKTENSRFRQYLLARGNIKSTVITIGHSIQIVLPYTSEDRAYDTDPTPISWPSELGTDCRVLIAHETHESAARFLYAITSHFTTNPVLMGLFPETIPSIRKHRVNKWELELPRNISGNPEPTIDTLGVGGKSQGRHYNYIKLDDIYGDKARDSEAEALTTKDWFDNIQAFFSTFAKDKLDLIGTRYSFDDIYAHAMERYGDQLVNYTRKIEEVNPQTGEIEITFPEEFTAQSLSIIKKNPRVYNAQYLNDPDASGSGFDKTWRRYFYWIGKNQIAIFAGDNRKRTVVNVRDLDICILIDPGIGKTGGFAVTGMDYLGRVFVLTSMPLSLGHPELTELVFRSVARWQPRLVAIESDFFASVFEHWWKSEMLNRGVRFHIEPVYTKKREKDLRISGLSNYMSAEQFYINEAQTDLDEEVRVWGKSKNIHILDALAYGPEVWRPGYMPGAREEIDKLQEDVAVSNQDIETGYSAI